MDKYGITLIISNLLLLMLLPASQGYWSGAPRSVCGSMQPSHSPHRPQQSESPYTVNVEGSTGMSGPLTYTPGQVFQVTLSGSQAFKGFLLQARSTSGSEDAVGTFIVEGRPSTHRETCEDQALTQKNARSKRSLTSKWTAPSTPVGDIVFVSTVVQKFDTFWVDIRSNLLADASLVTTLPPPTVLPPGVNVTDLCQERNLEPLEAQRPHVAILCANDSHCPCGWFCCPECDDAEIQMCLGYAICRKPRQVVSIEVVEENH